MSEEKGSNRRNFLKTATSVAAAGAMDYRTANAQGSQAAGSQAHADAGSPGATQARVRYPRSFTGRQLPMIAFPLGGIGTGCISLGGRGQLRDWEIYNRPDKGRSPEYAFASIWVQSGAAKPIARVLEARLLPPYASESGLGPRNAPGLSRLDSATFTGEFPTARVDFHDSQLPVRVSLEAFSPFIPLDLEASGLPVAVLRYRVRNPRTTKAQVSIAFAIDNPVGTLPNSQNRAAGDGRACEFRTAAGGSLQGLFMTNPELAATDPRKGSFAMSILNQGNGKLTYLRGWPGAKWWASPMLYWDDFREDGQLGPEAEKRKTTGALCLQREIAPASEAEFTYLLTWHFPNRTPSWSGWTAPKDHGDTNIGNHYCHQFSDAWAAAEHVAQHLPDLERRTRSFVSAMRESTLPDALRDAAMANLSTLVTQTCFRTADGEFHGFEGCGDQRGCCFGNCTHVWNYETATQFLFPSLARSLRKAAFGYSQDERGGMRFRQMLPDGIDRYGFAAADGQMGQIIKTYLDWKLSGDSDWLRGLWPHVQKAIAYAWIPGGWDPNRDGVMEGVQHNTYDVEFYGPNPLGTVYYLGALRAAEEMARAIGDAPAGAQYRELFNRGSAWIDANLFNGEYYIQKIRSIPKEEIDRTTISNMGSEDTNKPEFQLGDGCLADQLIGQYLADIAGLGPLVKPEHIRKTLESIYHYNYRTTLFEHDSVQRIYALNDEAALLICDYGKGTRPKIPFPYYSEAWTGIEYLVSAQLIAAGMLSQGLQVIESARRRFDGERRNPWDEPECGHHYARAMSSWSNVIAWSGFDYYGSAKTLTLAPRTGSKRFRSFWSNGSGWGMFDLASDTGNPKLAITVTEGTLPLRAIRLKAGAATQPSLSIDGEAHTPKADRDGALTKVSFNEVILRPGQRLTLTL